MDGLRWLIMVTMGAVLLSGCASRMGPAPIESRDVPGVSTPSVKRASVAPTAPAPVTARPSAEASSSLAPDGFYRIKRGDTLIGISLDHGVSWRDLASWNQIDNPNLIEVDQLIRVRPPAVTTPASAARTQDGRPMEVRPIGPIASAPASPPLGAGPSSVTPPAPGAGSATAPAAGPGGAVPRPPAAAAETISLSWPGRGQVITQFSDPGYKGIALSGAEGDPVLAAGDGRVVYSGSGLRGYGNLVIVKHEGDFLTAYAHNRSILVSEGQTVKRGQKIAELGKTDSEIPKLHFEVRRAGKPVDPMKFLAQR